MLWYFYRVILQHIPIKVAYTLAALLGHISYTLSKGRRMIMEEELNNIFQRKVEDKEKKRIVLKAFDNWMKVITEVLLFPTLTPQKTSKMISIVHRERLDRALDQNKGVILLTFHFGANRMALPALGYLGYKVNQIAAPPTKWREILGVGTKSIRYKTMELEELCERSLPVKFIYIDNFMRRVLECLKKNEILVIAGDGGGGRMRMPVPFLNRTAMISGGPIFLAQKTGAPLLPIFMVRQENDSHKLFIEEPIDLKFQGDKEKDAIYNLEKLTRLAERYIKKYPCHYLKYLWLIRKRLDKDPVPFFDRCLRTI